MKKTALEGLHVWSAFQPDRGMDFNGFFWARRGGVLIDPLPLDARAVEIVRDAGGARWILVTNADHWRAAGDLHAALGAEVWAPAAERERLERDGRRVDRWFGSAADLPSELRDDVHVVPIRGGKSPGEVALFLRPIQALAFGDVVRSHASGRLEVLKDEKLADRNAVLDSLRRVIPLPFDAVLVGDGECVWHDGREAFFRMLDGLPGTLFNKVSLNALEFAAGSRFQKGAETESAQVSRHMTCRQLGYHMRRLLPGNVWPAYHYETGEEELFLVWKGSMKVRTPQGLFPVVPGDLVAMPAGPAHAHQFVNDGAAPCEFLCLSNLKPQSLAYYPDSNRINVSERGELYRVADRREDYWEDDPTVGRGAGAGRR